MDPRQPYPSQRSPVCARNMVATSQPLAVAAGLQALRAGGNAVDAALAAAITLTVVEPNNNGVGSDAFALVWDGSSLHGLNGSGRSPAGWEPERFAQRSAMPDLGWDTVTVPGAVSAWQALSQRFGRLPFAALFEDAIRYARDGFQVGPKTAFYWRILHAKYADFPDFLAHFYPAGRAPAAGELFRRPDLAQTLEELAASRGESLYRGALAERIVAASEAQGGCMSREDLAAHRPDWVEPIDCALGDARLHEIPPNGQGLGALIAAGVLDRLGIERHAVDSLDAVHLQIEAARIGIREAFAHVADIDHMAISPAELLAPQHLDELAARVDPARASDVPLLATANPDTVYLTTADADGMMVSFIQSNYLDFGSGIVIPGTGISMQNRGRGFVIDPHHPNRVGPRKRPYQTIIPGFATRDGAPLLSFGVMGGHMQHQGHLQMMVRVALHGQNPQAASDAPRWHVRQDGSVALEVGFDAEVMKGLADRGHRVDVETAEHVFGGAQLIQRLDDGYCGGSDHRKEGCAAGF